MPINLYGVAGFSDSYVSSFNMHGLHPISLNAIDTQLWKLLLFLRLLCLMPNLSKCQHLLEPEG